MGGCLCKLFSQWGYYCVSDILVKDKTGDLTSSNNYRVIALTTVFCLIIDPFILNRFGKFLETEPNQFGSKL